MSEKTFFHEVPQSEIESFPDNMTWGDIQEKYKQPDWCEYPDALNGQMGCWSLIDLSGELRLKISKEYCGTCDCFKKH